MEGIARITQECGWDPAPFDRAAARVKELDYANEWVWKKPKSNRPRTLKAEVVVNYGIDAATLTMQVRDKAGAIVRRETFASEKPDELIFKRHLGELRWLDEKTVAVLPQYGEGRVEVTVD